jgi:hypothetical protein
MTGTCDNCGELKEIAVYSTEATLCHACADLDREQQALEDQISDERAEERHYRFLEKYRDHEI